MPKPGRPRTYWIPVEAGVHDRSKTLDLADRLGLTPDAVVGLLTRLWLWNLQERDTGDVTDLKPMMLAHAARWTGDAETFVCHLKDSGWIRTRRGRDYLSGWRRMVEPSLRELARKREDYQRFKRKKFSGKTTGKQPTVGARTKRIPHPTNTPTEKKKTQRAKPDPDPKRLAAVLIAQYERMSGHKATDATHRLLTKQITADTNIIARMDTARENYANELDANPPDHKRFIITTRNWFGREQRWKEHERADPEASKPSRRKGNGTGHDPTRDALGQLHLTEIDHSTSDDDDAGFRYSTWLKTSTEQVWITLDPAEQTARIEKATAEIKALPEGRRMTKTAIAESAEHLARRGLAADLPDFKTWRAKHDGEAQSAGPKKM